MSHDRIRVLHVLGTGRLGGVGRFVCNVVAGIDRSRFELAVLITGEDGPMADELRASGIPVHVLGGGNRLGPMRAWRFVRLVARGRYDLLHIHLGGRMLRYLARLGGAPRIVAHLHGAPQEFLPALRTGAPVPSRTIAKILFTG